MTAVLTFIYRHTSTDTRNRWGWFWVPPGEKSNA